MAVSLEGAVAEGEPAVRLQRADGQARLPVTRLQGSTTDGSLRLEEHLH